MAARTGFLAARFSTSWNTTASCRSPISLQICFVPSCATCSYEVAATGGGQQGGQGGARVLGRIRRWGLAETRASQRRGWPAVVDQLLTGSSRAGLSYSRRLGTGANTRLAASRRSFTAACGGGDVTGSHGAIVTARGQRAVGVHTSTE